MTKTANYQLNQWDAADRVLRADFNGDNQKIDAAIAGVRGALPRFITGSYTGTGETSVTKHYSLGGRPKMVLLRTENVYSGNVYDTGFLLTDLACIFFNSSTARMQAPGNPAGLEDDGFYIVHDSSAKTGLNREGVVQHYWAWM